MRDEDAVGHGDSLAKTAHIDHALNELTRIVERFLDDADDAACLERLRRWKGRTRKVISALDGPAEAMRFSRLPLEINGLRTLASVERALYRHRVFLETLREEFEDHAEVEAQSLPQEEIREEMIDNLRLFISHSSQDQDYVRLLIDLLRSALNLLPKHIRCTSVDGYRLPIGADTIQQLRVEIDVAETFIGVISERSLQSQFVLFELGARWGARKRLNPLLAPGTDPRLLAAPLSNLNGLDGAEPAQLHQLVHDLAEQLALQPSPPAAYQANIDSIVGFARTVGPAKNVIAQDIAAPEQRSSADLSDQEKTTLLLASKDPRGRILIFRSDQSTAIQTNNEILNEPQNARSIAAWIDALESLRQRGLVEGKGAVFSLTHKGFGEADKLSN